MKLLQRNHWIVTIISVVFILDGNLEIGAHVRSNLCYLTCLRHLIRSKAVTNRKKFIQKDLLSSISTITHEYYCFYKLFSFLHFDSDNINFYVSLFDYDCLHNCLCFCLCFCLLTVFDTDKVSYSINCCILIYLSLSISFYLSQFLVLLLSL